MPMAKRILKIEIKRMDDQDPDISFIGQYISFIGQFSNHAETQFAIDHHERDRYSRHTPQWFNPGSVESFSENASWIPVEVENKRQYWHDAMTKNAEMDYQRALKYDRGEFGFIGIRVQAEIVVDSVCQTITSGGLWGIESDSDESYLKEVEQEELSSLRGILHEMGFSKRAIASAVKESDL